MSLTPPKNLPAVSLTPVNNFSAVSLTPAINFCLFGYFWPVSTTPGKNVIAGVNDTGDKLYWWQRSALAAILSPAADIVIGRPRRPPKLLQTKTALFGFGGLRGLWLRCVGCFSNDTIGGRGRLQRPEISPIYPLQLSPFLGSSPPPWRPCSCDWQ